MIVQQVAESEACFNPEKEQVEDLSDNEEEMDMGFAAGLMDAMSFLRKG